MAAWYDYPSNFSGNQSVEGIGQWFQYSNYIIGDKLGIVILLLAYVIPFLALKASSTDKAFAATSFFAFIVALMLYRLDMITFGILIIPIILLTLAVITARSEREKIGL